MKLFLHAEKQVPALATFTALREPLPAGFWPATFIVDDACLTNARSIWLMKHLYL